MNEDLRVQPLDERKEVGQRARHIDSQHTDWAGLDLRSGSEFPALTEEMVERLKPYGRRRTFPPDSILYTYGDVETDMFVVLKGGVDVYLPASDGGVKITGQHRAYAFTGEFNLLNSQRAVVEARTICESVLLCIGRKELRRLMLVEGDIANLIVQAAIGRRISVLNQASSGVTLTGRLNDPAMTRLRRFFVRNNYPCLIEEVSEQTSADEGDFPGVRLPDGRLLRRPEVPELADELGITELPHPDVIYDVAVVGAGPAGLAAAVYAASEGLCTIVIEGLAPGGQAGTSSRIENYLGFPSGIGGQELASRAHFQALKFGVHFAISRETIAMESFDGIHRLILAGGAKVSARAIVVATGAQYRKLMATNHERYENCGLFYAATPMETLHCWEKDVIVVGGGNSAGQASVFLSGIARHVHHIVRGPSVASSMSRYLISRIENSSRITLCTNCEIVEFEGDHELRYVTWVNSTTGERTQKQISSVFVMVGAEPNSGWLYGTVRLDNKGFVLTGGTDGFEATPYATNIPGIFAVGDVRANSVKRVASAVGEGSVVISDVHRYLARNQCSGRTAVQIGNPEMDEVKAIGLRLPSQLRNADPSHVRKRANADMA